MNAAATVHSWLAAGSLEIPPPGHGHTGDRWRALADLCAQSLPAGRLAEAHTDAVAILQELAGPPRAGELWAVWAAEAPDAVVSVSPGAHGVVLDGTKRWCSGAGICSRALVTATHPSGDRALFAVDLTSPGVRVVPGGWHQSGMADTDTRTVRFDGVAATPVGAPGAYLDRPGFWFGAIGVAACWLGGARAVAEPLYTAVAGRVGTARADPHAQAHLGAVDAALFAGDTALRVAAAVCDDRPESAHAEVVARRVRAVVETAVDTVLARVGRALGPAPLVDDTGHAQRVADLTIYVRQSHAERDLAALGAAVVR